MNNQLIKAFLVSALIIAVCVGIYYIKRNPNLFNNEFRVVDDIIDVKSTALKSEDNKFYMYTEGNQKYLVFKVKKFTYTDSIKINSIELKRAKYDGMALNLTLNIDVEEGESDPLRDWPLTDEKYVIMKIDQYINDLYVNGTQYSEL